jgi:hypothetical protein
VFSKREKRAGRSRYVKFLPLLFAPGSIFLIPASFYFVEKYFVGKKKEEEAPAPVPEPTSVS